MHCFTVVSFVAVSMSALSVVFGNPVDNTATGMTNPKLNRRETKELKLKLTHSVFYKKWKVESSKLLNDCEMQDVERLHFAGSKTAFANETRNAQGVYFEDKKWYHGLLPEFGSERDGCYMTAEGPRNRNNAKLDPFTSIVTKSYGKDKKLRIKELEGRKVDNKAKHNGCVMVVDDYTEDNDLSLYISTAERKEKYFKGLDKVSVIEDDDCEIQQYKLE